MEFNHYSVMLKETIDGLDIKKGGIYVDCTLGGGGHSEEILKRLDGTGRVIGIDQDTDAIKASKERLREYSNITYVHNNFYNISEVLDSLGIDKVDGIVMDLGVSSYQLDTDERGFSFHRDAPLDMRMDREQSLSAYNIINEYGEMEIYRIIRDFGEEKFAKNIAKHIVIDRQEKKIETTFELVEILKKAIPAKFRKDSHPGKKTFQAIRIAVNNELGILYKAINDSIDRLNEDGRLSIISFHSLEDRIVKNVYRDNANPCTCPREFPVCNCGLIPKVKIITRKPIEASKEELEVNNRSRSAKLRVCKKLCSNKK